MQKDSKDQISWLYIGICSLPFIGNLPMVEENNNYEF